MEKFLSILVVDDDPDIGNMLKLMLEFKGYHITLIDSANEVENIVEEGNFGLIILDMLIGDINGTDVCKRLKNNSRISKIPVIMFSALPDAVKICLEAGSDDFVSKPFEMVTMLSKIEHFMNRQAVTDH